ncbi:hypothetical protein D3C75_900340 [compost metagenome]
MHYAIYISVEDAVDIFHRRLSKRAEVAEPCIAEQHVQRAVLTVYFVNYKLDAARICDFKLNEMQIAFFVVQLLVAGQIPCAGVYSPAFTGEFQS